jgi:hypothetical protein
VGGTYGVKLRIVQPDTNATGEVCMVLQGHMLDCTNACIVALLSNVAALPTAGMIWAGG